MSGSTRASLSWLGALVVAACVVASLWGKLDNPFLIDDRQTIVESTTIDSLADAWFPEKDTPVAGRPLPNVTLALDHARAGDDPGPYHRTNLGFHLVNAGLVFLLLLALGGAPRAGELWRRHAQLVAGVAAALWAAHPLHVETILYATQRTELCFAAFALATLVAAVRAMAGGGRGWVVAAGVAALGAALSKESAVLLLPLVVLLDRGLFAGSFAAVWRERRALLVALVPSLVVIALVVASKPRSLSVVWFDADYLLAQGTIVWHYVLLVVWPVDLIADYGNLIPGSTTPRVVGLAALALAAVVGLVALVRFPRGGLFGAWVLGLLAPTSSFAAIHTEVGAERRMYLPLVAFAVVAVLGALWLARATTARRVAGAVGLAVFVALLLRTRARADDYQDLEALWKQTIETYPANSNADYNLGELYRQDGRIDEALAKYRDALEKTPKHRMARTNLGALLFSSGRREEGMQHLQRAAVQDGVFHEPWNNLGTAHAMLQRWPEAERAYRNAVAIRPEDPKLRLSLGKVLSIQGRKGEAAEHLERAVAGGGSLEPAELEHARQLLESARR